MLNIQFESGKELQFNVQKSRHALLILRTVKRIFKDEIVKYALFNSIDINLSYPVLHRIASEYLRYNNNNRLGALVCEIIKEKAELNL